MASSEVGGDLGAGEIDDQAPPVEDFRVPADGSGAGETKHAQQVPRADDDVPSSGDGNGSGGQRPGMSGKYVIQFVTWLLLC